MYQAGPLVDLPGEVPGRFLVMSDAPLMLFEAHVGGQRADVKILSTRIVWSTAGRRGVTEMVPLTAISSVTTHESQPSKWSLVVNANGKAIEFQVEEAVADQATSMLRLLVAKQPPPINTSVKLSGSGSLADDLNNLKWLLDNGLLSESEFDDRRAHLFGLL